MLLRFRTLFARLRFVQVGVAVVCCHLNTSLIGWFIVVSMSTVSAIIFACHWGSANADLSTSGGINRARRSDNKVH